MAKSRLPQSAQSSRRAKMIGIPMGLLIGGVIIYALFSSGYLDMSNGVREITNEATLNVPYEGFDFAPSLIPLLNPDYNGDRSGYTFYLGSGVGFPPMGLILGIDGILRGTPTGRGGNFEVCVKDVGGNSVCRTYHLNVNDPSEDEPQPGGCPTEPDPPCGTTGGAPGEIQHTAVGVYVYNYCQCPTGTHFYTDVGEMIYCECDGAQ